MRLKRTELTTEVQSNVFDRMRTEREREANLLRAEGQELSQKITPKNEGTLIDMCGTGGENLQTFKISYPHGNNINHR